MNIDPHDDVTPAPRSPLASGVILLALYTAMYVAVALVLHAIDPAADTAVTPGAASATIAHAPGVDCDDRSERTCPTE